MLNVDMLSVIVLSVTFSYCSAECHHAECRILVFLFRKSLHRRLLFLIAIQNVLMPNVIVLSVVFSINAE